ncbi:MAG: hypothetical protein JWM12_2325 [Ilumatobacteraceae bacterium]|nr:hypothetical protein [Ilumatobacteraceae bacterium]
MGVNGQHAQVLFSHRLNAIEGIIDVGSPVVRRIVGLTTTCVCLMVVAAGCNHDGRYLRPAQPDQNATISTTIVPTTTVAGAFQGGLDPAAGDGEFTTPTGDLAVDASATTTTAAVGAATTTTAAGAAASTLPRGSAVAPWRDGSAIDARYTCDGENISPPMSWTRAPTGTVEIALTMTDEQAPGYVHWAVAGIDPAITSVPESTALDGAIVATNSAGAVGYTGPCPPQGQTHTYELTVHFLGAQTELGDGAAGADMLVAIQSNTIASAVLTGTYTRR